MNTLLLLVLLFSIVFLSHLWIVSYNVKELFSNNDTIILMGDSILENSNYVSKGKSVADILKTKTNKVYNFAKDEATINDLYTQLDKISYDFNTSNTHIFISAGGNDILTKPNLDIEMLFNNYNSFLKALKEKLGKTKLNLLNLYLPSSPRYKSYAPSVTKWNQLIVQNSSKLGVIYNVVSLESLLVIPSDFVYDIEPSESGSVKIANSIYFTS